MRRVAEKASSACWVSVGTFIISGAGALGTRCSDGKPPVVALSKSAESSSTLYTPHTVFAAADSPVKWAATQAGAAVAARGRAKLSGVRRRQLAFASSDGKALSQTSTAATSADELHVDVDRIRVTRKPPPKNHRRKAGQSLGSPATVFSASKVCSSATADRGE